MYAWRHQVFPSQRLEEIRRSQRPRPQRPPHEQQNLLRRDRTQRQLTRTHHLSSRNALKSSREPSKSVLSWPTLAVRSEPRKRSRRLDVTLFKFYKIYTTLILFMSKESGLIIGSIIFLVLGVVATIVFYVYVGMKSPPQAVSANRQYWSLYLGWQSFHA